MMASAPGDFLLPAALGFIRQLGEGVDIVEVHLVNIRHVRRDVARHGDVNQEEGAVLAGRA